MATAAYAVTYSIGNTRADKFIPEQWSDEILAAYEKSLVMAPLVRTITHGKRKGDTIHIPNPIRGTASAKAEGVVVSLNYNTALTVTVLIDKHYEYSVLIEDITELQQLASHRAFLLEDAGYALAKQEDTDVIRLGRALNGATIGTNDYASASATTKAWIGSTGATAYNTVTSNASALTEEAIRRSIQRLDDDGIPTVNRRMVIPPVAKNSLLGISRFTEYNMVGETGKSNSLRNGEVGMVFGLDVFVTNNADTTATSTDRIVLIFQESAFLLARQQKIRSQTQYKQEALGTLFTADTVYGVKALRAAAHGDAGLASAGVALAVPG